MSVLRVDHRALAPAVVALPIAAIGGALAVWRFSYMPVVIACGAMAIAALRWRAGVVVLIVTLPFAGLPAFAAGEPGLAVRDLFIVVPLYAAFAIEMTRTRDRLVPDIGIAVAALAVFAGLVVMQTLRSPNVLSGAIGLRVWLAYVPMFAVGYRFVRTARDLEVILKITGLLGLIPVALACAEFAYAVTRGDFGPFERVYGAWRLTETQRFVVFTVGDDHLRIPRIPATFTGVTQYFGFSMVAFAAALAMAFRRGGAWALCAVALAAGSLASGARAAYVAIPAIAIGSLVLSGVVQRRPHAVAVAAGAYLAFAVIAGSAMAGIAQEVPSHVFVSLRTGWSELSTAVTLTGHGTGWDTNAALRYGGVDGRRYIESWYAKAILELGLAGLVAIVCVFVSLIWKLWRGLPALDAQSRRLAAPVCALLFVTTVLLFKGPYIDLDPLNVYFWLLLGALFGLYEVSAQGGSKQ